MIGPEPFVATHAPMLVVGTTALLSAGASALMLQRSPIHRQRTAEMTVLCVLAWTILACVPMWRWSPALGNAPTLVSHASMQHVMHGTSASDSEESAAVLPSDWRAALATLVRLPPSDSSGAARGSPLDEHGAPLASPTIASSPVRRPDVQHRRWLAMLGVAGVDVYLACAAGCAAWLLLGHLVLWRHTARARRPEAWLAALFDQACRAVGVRRARLWVAPTNDGPQAVSFGVFCPTVLLGPDDCAPANRPRLRQVLLHEAAHLRQHDAWGNALFNLAMPLLYVHPLYWMLRSRASLAREMVADDIAAHAGSTRTAYAADLLALACSRRGYVTTPVAALGIFRSPSHFYRRMQMLMQRNHRLDDRCSTPWRLAGGIACLGALITATAMLGVRRAAAQEAPKTDEAEVKQAHESIQSAARGGVASDEPADQDRDRQQQRNADDSRRVEGSDKSPADLTSRALAEKLHALIAQRDAELAQLRAQITQMQAQVQVQVRAANEKVRQELERARRWQTEQAGRMGASASEDAQTNGQRNITPDDPAAYKLYQDQRRRDERMRDAFGGRPEVGGAQNGFPNGPMAYAADAARLNAAVGELRPQLDLVALANSYADAEANVATIRAEGQAMPDDPHARSAHELKLAAAEHKARLFRSIAKAALQQAQQELDLQQRLVRSGAAQSGDILEFQGRVKILSLILQPNPEAPGGADAGRP